MCNGRRAGSPSQRRRRHSGFYDAVVNRSNVGVCRGGTPRHVRFSHDGPRAAARSLVRSFCLSLSCMLTQIDTYPYAYNKMIHCHIMHIYVHINTHRHKIKCIHKKAHTAPRPHPHAHTHVHLSSAISKLFPTLAISPKICHNYGRFYDFLYTIRWLRQREDL